MDKIKRKLHENCSQTLCNRLHKKLKDGAACARLPANWCSHQLEGKAALPAVAALDQRGVRECLNGWCCPSPPVPS
ncbi:MAG: hypothetical protein SNJ80_14310, partial [Anaerolinea sp.]